MNSSAIKLIKSSEDQGAGLYNLAVARQTGSVTDLVARVGGPNSEGGRQIALGVTTHILNMSEELGKNSRQIINPVKLTTHIEDLKKSGLMDVLLPPEVAKDLDGFMKYAVSMPSPSGSDPGMAAGALAGAMWSGHGIRKAFGNFLKVKLYTMGWAQRVALSMTDEGIPGEFKWTPALARALTSGYYAAAAEINPQARKHFGLGGPVTERDIEAGGVQLGVAPPVQMRPDSLIPGAAGQGQP